ncbi:MAG TPA: hypothetical protein DCS83_06345 [Prevotella sp.]|jgi:hypothetical protein|nr:hypothetical protein [uncultured Prevotella sp.]MCH4241662.1 hypothetical protein [Prevotella sp.]HAT62153.1 hypothetical protein [Prevotella sp.]
MSKEKARSFFNLVAKMRSAQRNYYAARKKNPEQAKMYLKESIDIERQVDSVISKTYDILNARKALLLKEHGKTDK